MFQKISIILILCLIINTKSHNEEWFIKRELDETEMVKFSLILENRNIHILEELFNNISNPRHEMYGQYLIYENIYEIIKIPNDMYIKIEKINKKNNFKCKFYGDYFNCLTTKKNIENVFKIKMYEYKNIKNSKISIVRSNTDYIIPEKYNDIKFIDGLSNYLFPLKNKKYKNNISNNISNNNSKDKNKTPDTRYFGKETVQNTYNLTYTPVYNLSVVAWEFLEGGYIQKFMDYSQKYNGVSVRNVSLLVGSNIPDDAETDLDLEMLLNYDNINVFYGQTNGWLLEGFNDMLNLALKHKLPDVISISYGWSEYDMCDVTTCNNITSFQYVQQANINFLKLGLMGYTLVVASGDAGSKGRTDETCVTDKLNPDFPGSSPYVISVGATYTAESNNSVNFNTLLCEQYGCITGNFTYPANYNYVYWTTGGNFDGYYNASSWEKFVNEEYLNSGVYLPNISYNKYGHGVPTVVMNGHNCPVYGLYEQSAFNDIDGTSCSTPLFAGLLTYLNDFQLQNGRNKIGPAQQLLYLLATEFNYVYNSVGNGNTWCTEQKCCTHDDGFHTPPIKTTWNPVFGLGQPNFGLMTYALNELFNY